MSRNDLGAAVPPATPKSLHLERGDSIESGRWCQPAHNTDSTKRAVLLDCVNADVTAS
jgi:hypothetical protein